MNIRIAVLSCVIFVALPMGAQQIPSKRKITKKQNRKHNPVPSAVPVAQKTAVQKKTVKKTVDGKQIVHAGRTALQDKQVAEKSVALQKAMQEWAQEFGTAWGAQLGDTEKEYVAIGCNIVQAICKRTAAYPNAATRPQEVTAELFALQQQMMFGLLPLLNNLRDEVDDETARQEQEAFVRFWLNCLGACVQAMGQAVEA